MNRSAPFVAALLLGLVSAAWSQEANGSNSGFDITQGPPGPKVRGAAVRARAPGRVVNEARARLTGESTRTGSYFNTGGSATNGTTGNRNTGSSGFSSGGGLLGGLDLAGLLGQFANSGLLPSLLNSGGGSLTGALGRGQSAGGSSAVGTRNNATGNSNIPPNITPEALQMLQDAGFNIDDLFPPRSGGTGSTSTVKASGRSQQQTEQTPFVIRWGNAVLQTTFAAIVLAFQTPDFRDLLVDMLRPIFIPSPDSGAPGGEGGGSGTGTGGGQSGGGSGGQDEQESII
jgi:hypothetical protein